MQRITVLFIFLMSMGIAQVPGATRITNVAQCTYTDLSDFPYTIASDTVETVVADAVSLTILKTGNLTTMFSNDTLTYSLEITNTGVASAVDVIVTDTLPAGLLYLATDPVASVTGQTVTWNFPQILGNETIVLTLQAITDGIIPAGVELVNTAWTQYDNGVPVPSNPYLVTVGPSPDVSIVKTVDAPEGLPGDTLVYSLFYTNTGNQALTNISINDVLPAGAAFLSSLPDGVYSSAEHAVSWTLDSLNLGASGEITLVTNIADTVDAYVTLENQVFIATDQGANDVSSAVTAIGAAPELNLDKWAPDRIVPGDTLVYGFHYSNTGLTSAKQVVLRDTLPVEVEFISASGLYFYEAESHSVAWELGSLTVGQEDSLTVLTRVHTPLGYGTQIINRAYLDCYEQLRAWDQVVTQVKMPVLQLDLSGDTTSSAGNPLEYTLFYSNSGDTTAHEVLLTDTLPSGVTFVSASDNGQYMSEYHGVRWEIGVLTVNESGSRTILVTIDDTTHTNQVLTDAAEINSIEGAHADDVFETYMVPLPEFSVEKSAAESILAGDTLTYTISYSNVGTTPVTEAVITDTLPAQAGFIYATGPFSYQAASHVLTWNLGTVPAGDDGTLSVITQANSSLTGGSTIHNTVYMTSRENIVRASETWTTVQAPVLVLDKTVDTTDVFSGDSLTYYLTYSNRGDTTALDVTLVDTLPERVTYLYASGESTYDEANRVVTWTLGDLLPVDDTEAGIQVAEVAVRIDNPIPDGSTIHNQAIIRSADGLADTSDVTFQVISKPAIELIKHATVEVFPGDEVMYTIQYANRGTDIATDIFIRDTLPPEVNFISATGTYTYNSTIAVLEWDIGYLEPGEEGSITIQTTVTPTLGEGDQFYNTAWAYYNEGDPVHSESVTTNILPLSIVLTPNPRVVLGNGEASAILNAHVYSYLGNPVPDGMPVTFASDRGTIPDILDTTYTVNGLAQSLIISDIVVDQPVDATITGRAIPSPQTFAEDTTIVTFVIGAFEGWVVDYEGTAISGAVVDLVRTSDDEIVRTDTTDSEGYYLIPVSTVDEYYIQYMYLDDFGNEVSTEQEVQFDIPSNGDIIPNLNSVSGWLYDQFTGRVINEAGITIILWFVPDSSNGGNGRMFADTWSDTTITDSTGMYYFTNLDSGNYFLEANYNGTRSYSDGAINVNLSNPGTYVVGANIVLRQSPFYMYKTVDMDEAAPGDTLFYTLYYGSQDVALTDSVYVVDNIPTGLTVIEPSIQVNPTLTYDGYDRLGNILAFHRIGLTLHERDSLTFQAIVGTSEELNGSSLVENISFVTNKIDTTQSIHDARTNAITRIIYPFLRVKKDVNRRVAELGDVLTYTVQVENTSRDEYVDQIKIVDFLPTGFKQKSKNVYWDNNRVGKPAYSSGTDNRIILTWSIDDTLNPGESKLLKYRTIIGLQAQAGENDNLVSANGRTMGGYPVTSNEAKATVVVHPGLFSDRGLIFGKVYYDLNGNDIHDEYEPGIKGVELISETGIRILTDEYGKYSIPDVPGGNHVIRINEYSIPANHEVVLNEMDYLGDNSSRLVYVSPGGIAKANFSVRIIHQAETQVRSDGLDIALSNVSLISLQERAKSDGVRIMRYQPWSMLLRLGFLSGESVLRPEIYTEMRKVAQFLQWQPHIYLTIEGHTDNIDPPESSPFENNLDLSMDRANNIKKFLVDEMGISANRISSRGYGETRPIASNETAEGRKANRRVELIFSTSNEEQPHQNAIELTFNIRTRGGIPYDKVRFIDALPSGFIYASNSARLNGEPLAPDSVSSSSISWLLGSLAENDTAKLVFNIIPGNYAAINDFNISKAHIEYEYEDGKSGISRDLITNVSVLIEKLSFQMNLEGTNFDVNSATLRGSSADPIEKLGKFLTWQPNISIVIDGFTDSDGDLNYNLALSKSRAESVKSYLVENYLIQPSRIATRGFGPRYPLAGNNTEAGKAKNRRVEVLVNSEIGSDLVMGVEVIRDSVGKEIQTQPRRMAQSENEDVLNLPDEGPVSLRLHLDMINIDTADQIEIFAQMPHYVKLISDFDQSFIGERMWRIPISSADESITIDVKAYVDPGFQTDIFKVSTRLIRDNQPITDETVRVIRLTTNKSYANAD